MKPTHICNLIPIIKSKCYGNLNGYSLVDKIDYYLLYPKKWDIKGKTYKFCKNDGICLDNEIKNLKIDLNSIVAL